MKLRLLLLMALTAIGNVNCWNNVTYTRRVTLSSQNIIFIAQDSNSRGDFHRVDISVTNKTTNPILISPSSFNFSIINNQESFTNSLFKKAAKIGITGMGLSFGTWLLESLMREEIITQFGALIVVKRPSFSNPFKRSNIYRYPFTLSFSALSFATVSALLAQIAYKKLRVDKELLLKDQVIINPGESVKKTIFFDLNACKSQFDFKVFNEDGSQVIHTFNVKLA